MARAVGKMWEKYCLRPALDSTPTSIPVFIYGTAWKKDRTADLVSTALNAGFRAVDTAAQPRHYQEHLVGDGIRKAIADGLVRREDLYVSTGGPDCMLNITMLTHARFKPSSAPSGRRTRTTYRMMRAHP